MLTITSGSTWLYVEWNAQSATFRILYRSRESGAPSYQVIAPPTSQLSHNISVLQQNTLYNIVVEATHTVTQQKVNSSVTSAYTTPQGELKDAWFVFTGLRLHEAFALGSYSICSCKWMGKHVRLGLYTWMSRFSVYSSPMDQSMEFYGEMSCKRNDFFSRILSTLEHLCMWRHVDD